MDTKLSDFFKYLLLVSAILSFLSIIFYGMGLDFKIKKQRLKKNGIVEEGVVVGTWKVSNRRPFAIYMFPFEEEYYTGTISYPYEYEFDVKAGVRVQVEYLKGKPQINRGVYLYLDESSVIEREDVEQIE